MCGIVGYIGKHQASSILLDGLKRLEYRGYDSAGIATINCEQIVLGRQQSSKSLKSSVKRCVVCANETQPFTHPLAEIESCNLENGLRVDLRNSFVLDENNLLCAEEECLKDLSGNCSSKKSTKKHKRIDEKHTSVVNVNCQLIKQTGQVDRITKLVGKQNLIGTVGIAHTRWATHGGITNINAHPHISSDGKFVIAHNGVIENYHTIKNFLKKLGYSFISETDTEVIANLIAYHYKKEKINGKSRFVESVRKSLFHLEGTYGLTVMCLDCPDEIVGVRKSSPLILGLGDKEYIIASDPSACAIRTNNVVFLRDDEIVHIRRDDFSIKDVGERDVQAVIQILDWDMKATELSGYKHFMEKEIFEQPEALENTMRGRFSNDKSTTHLGGLALSAYEWRRVDRLIFCACGTAFYAGLVAKYLIEKYARIPVEVEYSSEFRYRNSPLEKNTLVFAISQSGETIDTLEALREAQRKGHRTLAISNVVGSSIARETSGGVYQRSGPEIGVASTKAFTGQLCVIAMLSLYLGRLRDMSYEDGVRFVEGLQSLPEKVRETLQLNKQIEKLAKKYLNYSGFMFLGRQVLYPIALEGALKLKEISYVYAEGFPAAEMKHGPIALVNENCPAIVLATQEIMFKKTLSNIQEIKARNGKIIVITTKKMVLPEGIADDIIYVPESNHEAIDPIISSIPLQLFSYHMGVLRGCNVDKPRNLAKSVTVE